MKLQTKVLTGLAVALVFGLAVGLPGVRADESVKAKLRALFPQFDADQNRILSPAEQTAAVESVRKQHGEAWAKQVTGLFKASAAANGSVSAEKWKDKVAAFGKQPELPKETYRVTMRDGVKLATDVYLPEGKGPFPVVLSRTPYSRVGHVAGVAGFVHTGLACVVQDMRGRFDSEGENLPFFACGWGEHQDGADTIAWIKKQPWCNGKIGTIGGSAGGITQNLLAGAAPEGLAAQHITVAAASLYHDITYTGGALRKADVENWTTGNKFDAKALELMRTHACYDDYWRQFDTSLKFSSMNTPAMHVGGWFDMFAQGTIDEFIGRQHHGGNGARGSQKLIMGPWTHGIGKMPAGELTFPKAHKTPEQYNAGRWFDHYLRGQNNGAEKEPAVAYYVMGDLTASGAPGNEWRFANDWPVPATETAYYFTGDKTLTTVKPATTSNATITYTFDPADPCPTLGGGNLTIARGPHNQNQIESRPDVVLFTTEPLTAPVEVTGRVKAKIFVDSSAADTDLSVRLCDVYPDGKSYMMAEGMLRLRYRKSFEKPEPLKPGQVEEVTVDCWSTSIVFNKGHRLRATVTSSNYPRFDLNPGTGHPWSDTGEKLRQTNHIHCDAAHPSCLLLPVVAAQPPQHAQASVMRPGWLPQFAEHQP